MDKNSEMIEVKRKTAYPYWAAAAVWVIAALFFPMYKVIHFVVIAALSAAAGIITYKLRRTAHGFKKMYNTVAMTRALEPATLTQLNSNH